MLIQAITMSEQNFKQYLHSVDFIRTHVFPGGCLPSISAVNHSVGRASDLRMVHLEDLTEHYATTLRAWRLKFHECLDEVRALGFDEAFLRLWHFYLCYCEAGFAERRIHLVQASFAKPASPIDVARRMQCVPASGNIIGSFLRCPPVIAVNRSRNPEMNLIDLAESRFLPDFLIRMGIRNLLKKRLRNEDSGSVELNQEKLSLLIDKLGSGPVALVPEKANEQHYEVPSQFFELALGSRKKYSSCFYPTGTETLDQAEEFALHATCQRAEIKMVCRFWNWAVVGVH